MSKEIIIVDGAYYQKIGTDLTPVAVIGHVLPEGKSCFTDSEPLKITNTHILDEKTIDEPKETRRERRKRERDKKKKNH